MRLLVKGQINVKYFLAVNEDPIEVGQGSKENSPFESPPPHKQKNNGENQDAGMKTDPEGAVEIRIRRVISGIGHAIEKAVR
jgi:hypothetical protein